MAKPMAKKPSPTATQALTQAAVPPPENGSALITGEAARLTKEDLETLRRTICPDLDEHEAKIYLHYARTHDADPLSKEAWAQIRFSKVKNFDGSDKKDAQGKQIYERRLVTGLSKHQVQKRLEERPDFAGLQSAAIYEKDEFRADLGKGDVTHIVKSINKRDRGVLVAAWAKLSRKDKTPYVHILYLSERVQTNYQTGKAIGNWGVMEETMLLKCCEMDCVRACYPKQFSAVKTEEEAHFEGEEIKAAAMQEITPKDAKTAEKIIEAEHTPVEPEIPDEPAIDTQTPAETGRGAYVNPEQMNAIKALMQEFQLQPAAFATLIEGELGRRPESLAKIIKPEYQKIARAFNMLRKGEWGTKDGHFDKPPEPGSDLDEQKPYDPKKPDEIPF